jgi:transaldolase
MKFLLDSGDPEEFIAAQKQAREKGSEIWGATTNPSLIAKKLAGKKITHADALNLQKQLVMQILELVPGAVSAEVYADKNTTADEMIAQGTDIATWHKRVVVKLPTTLEGFKARTALRKAKIPINNTLVFSQEQIFAICLHEQIVQKQFGPIAHDFPPFISPFVGRLDDKNIDGMMLVEHGMKIKQLVNAALWMLEASVRRLEHIKRGETVNCEIITAPLKTYSEWFSKTEDEIKNLDMNSYSQALQKLDFWQPPQDLLQINSIDAFMDAISSGKLSITHELTDVGIDKFAADWKAIIAE